MKRASELFREVDPGLTVVPGGRRRRSKKVIDQPLPEVSQYQPHKLTNEDWEAAGGVECSRCGKEVVRIRPQDGICLQCAETLDNKYFSDKKKRDKLLKHIKAHNARIDRKKKKGESILPLLPVATDRRRLME